MSVEKHPLNSSPTKNVPHFGRSSKRTNTQFSIDKFYDLPSTLSSRTCSFGFGNKTSFVTHSQAPPPNCYNVPDFLKNLRNKRFTFGYGRVQVVGGAIPYAQKSELPGPGQYSYSREGGKSIYIGRRLTQIRRSITPGPQAYSLENSSKYILSNHRNPGTPSIKSRVKTGVKNMVPGPGRYIVQSLNPNGKYVISKHRCCLVRSFGKEERPSLSNRNAALTPGPGQYSIFSQFGAQQKQK